MTAVLTDPAFWIAVTGWFVGLALVLGLCMSAAKGDRQMTRARFDVEERRRLDALNRAASEPVSPVRRSGGWVR